MKYAQCQHLHPVHDGDRDYDGIPDLNIDSDGDGVPDLNIDTDNDGKPDINHRITSCFTIFFRCGT